MRPQVLALINTSALQHNLQQVRQFAPDAKVLAVIKADAYGHGLANAAHALSDADAFAVGTLIEANHLRKITTDKLIVILQGVEDVESLQLCVEQGFQVVIHSQQQLDQLQLFSGDQPLNCWIKMDTGMHRLGLPFENFEIIVQQIGASPSIKKPAILMSHLACADEPARSENDAQIVAFSELTEQSEWETSLCNSAGIVSFPQAHGDWVRPGIMLYGISPIQDKTAAELNLQPVMTLKSRLIAINELKTGDSVGYGASWQCPEDMRVGVIGIGYGDGYPRHAPDGTPVLINGRQAPLVGRVSMDLLMVDLRGQDDAQVGDEVVLWGDGLPIEIIAQAAGTIAYELVCRLTSRVEFQVVN